MQQVDYLTEFLGFQGFYVKGVEIEKEEDIEKAIITLGRDKRYICSECGRRVYSTHSSFVQEVRQNRNLRITDVAHSVGYDSIPHFERLFRKSYGTSPRQYRNDPH